MNLTLSLLETQAAKRPENAIPMASTPRVGAESSSRATAAKSRALPCKRKSSIMPRNALQY